jgi:hypothetical protein
MVMVAVAMLTLTATQSIRMVTAGSCLQLLALLLVLVVGVVRLVLTLPRWPHLTPSCTARSLVCR